MIKFNSNPLKIFVFFFFFCNGIYLLPVEFLTEMEFGGTGVTASVLGGCGCWRTILLISYIPLLISTVVLFLSFVFFVFLIGVYLQQNSINKIKSLR